MTVHNVSNQTELNTAIGAAVGGDSIVLAAGSTYSKFSTNRNPGSTVTVISADDNNRGTITGGSNTLDLNPGATNWRFENVNFKYVWVDGAKQADAFSIIVGATSIHFETCQFRGDVQGATGAVPGGYDATALEFKTSQSDQITINGCEFLEWFRAIKSVNGNSTNFTITNNNIHDLRSDGVVMSRMDTVLIKQNWFHRWQTSALDNAHPDMIQFHRSGTPGQGSHNITIEENVLDHEDGNFGQLIFCGTSNQTNGPVGDPIRHTNFTIKNNIIYGSHTHGITMNWCDGLTIEKNSLVRVNGLAGGDGPGQLSINVDGGSTSASIIDNFAEIVASGAGWTVTGNTEALISTYDTEFTKLATGTGAAGYNDYEIKSGGNIHTNNSGSRMMKRAGGWSGNEIVVASDYLGGIQSAGADTTPPAISSSNPADNATGVSVNVDPSVTFDETIVFGSGDITLYDVTGAAVLETFDVTTEVGSSPGQVNIAGNVLTIHPTSDLSNSNEYAIQWDATAIEDGSGNAHAGISDTTTLSFTTAAAGVQAITGSTITIELTVG